MEYKQYYSLQLNVCYLTSDTLHRAALNAIHLISTSI